MMRPPRRQSRGISTSAVSPAVGRSEFYVRDTGIGIEPEDLDKVFHVFRRGRSEAVQNVSGKGVGLASVKSIVETYSGTIWVESQLGKRQHVSVHDQRQARVRPGPAAKRRVVRSRTPSTRARRRKTGRLACLRGSRGRARDSRIRSKEKSMIAEKHEKTVRASGHRRPPEPLPIAILLVDDDPDCRMLVRDAIEREQGQQPGLRGVQRPRGHGVPRRRGRSPMRRGPG